MRTNGRSPDELRPFALQLNYLKYPDGSVLVEMGDTRVICTVTMDEKAPAHAAAVGKGWITSEYAMLPGATDSRSQRDVARGRQPGRSHEIQRMIGRVLRSVTDLGAISGRTLWVDCDVLQADGGTRTAAINGSFTALNLALLKYLEEGDIVRWPLRDTLGAVSVALLGGEILLDPDYHEDSEAEVDFNLGATGSGQLVEVQGTAEGHPFSQEVFEDILGTGLEGIERIIALQKDALRPSFETLKPHHRDLVPEEYWA
jgi:ribonuclease PH